MDDHSHQAKNSSNMKYMLLCGAASFAASLVANMYHPFEVLKTRLQSHDGKSTMNNVPLYRNSFQATKRILAEEGLRGLYKGFAFSFLTSSLANTIFFAIYERLKHYHESRTTHKKYLPHVAIASLEAAVLCVFLTEPVWIIKTRMLLNTDERISGLSNFNKSIREIHHQYGLKGFYRGLLPNIMLSFNGVVQMQTYEAMKALYLAYDLPQNGFLEVSFLAGGFSKLVSAVVSYPLTTVRTRIQQNQFFPGAQSPKYRNIMDIFVKISREEGISGFFKGLAPNLLKGVLQRGTYFYSYELMKQWLNVDEYKH